LGNGPDPQLTIKTMWWYIPGHHSEVLIDWLDEHEKKYNLFLFYQDSLGIL
jgi:hypothetical protein